MKKILSVAVLLMLVLIACTKNADINYTPDCGTTTKSFATDVSPLMQTYCATQSGCHATGSHENPGALVTYQQIYTYRSSIRQSIVSGSMPQGARLSTDQKNTIICWIDNGAPNN